jgi:hypothetical protein
VNIQLFLLFDKRFNHTPGLGYLGFYRLVTERCVIELQMDGLIQ